MDILDYLDKVCNYLVESDTSTYEKMMIIAEVASSANLSITQTNALVKKITNKSIEDFVNSDQYDDQYKWSKEMGVDGLLQILEQGKTPKEAFDFIMTKYSKSPAWVEEVKHKNIRHTSSLIAKTLEQQSPQALERLKKQQLDVTPIAKATTPNSQFNKAHKLITLVDRIDAMEQRMSEYEKIVQEQQLAIISMNARLTCAEQNISNTTLKLEQLEELSEKEKVMHLKEKGLSLPEISTTLSLPIRRVKYLVYQK